MSSASIILLLAAVLALALLASARRSAVASTHGHTGKIVARLAETLRAEGLEVEVAGSVA